MEHIASASAKLDLAALVVATELQPAVPPACVGSEGSGAHRFPTLNLGTASVRSNFSETTTSRGFLLSY
jgi:hypothetical protein